LSDVENAYILERAKKYGIPAQFVSAAPFKTKLEGEAEKKYVEILRKFETDVVVLAGFMRVLTPAFLHAFPMQVMNIHPALLPAFPGTHVQQKALKYGVKFSGCTVHFVDEGVDTGPIIIQSVVQVNDDDTVETLAARILKEEHRIYPQAIQLYAEGRLEIKDRKVKLKSAKKYSPPALHNPPLTGF